MNEFSDKDYYYADFGNNFFIKCVPVTNYET